MRLVERGLSRRRRRLGPPGVAWVLLIVGIAVSFQIGERWGNMIAQDQGRRFASQAGDVERRVATELDRYSDMIRGISALYAASHDVTPDEFDTYVMSVEAYARYPGLEELSFIRPSDPADTAMEPSARRWARESGLPSVIRQYTEDRMTRIPRDAFIVYQPVSRGSGEDASTAEQPGGAFLGWIEARIDTEGLLAGLFEYRQFDVGIELYDGDVVDPVRRVGLWPESAATSDDLATLRTERSFRAFDRQWTLRVRALPSMINASERESSTLIVFGTIAITLFVFALIWSLSRSRARAFRAVDEATAALKEREQMLAHQASHDMLTGLPNRRLLTDRLEMALARAPRRGSGVGLLFIDVDRFKDINDRLGHDTGDVVLTETAGRLRRTVRPSDTVARLGGDEFVVLCDDVDGVHEVEQIALRVLAVMAEPVRCREGSLTATGSIGIVFQPDGLPTDSETMLRRADKAMYAVKRHGRDGISLAAPIPA